MLKYTHNLVKFGSVTHWSPSLSAMSEIMGSSPIGAHPLGGMAITLVKSG